MAKLKTKTEFIAQIEAAKQASEATIEPLQHFREVALRIIADPKTPPEIIALIEARQQQIQALLKANDLVNQQMAELFFTCDLDALFPDDGATA